MRIQLNSDFELVRHVASRWISRGLSAKPASRLSAERGVRLAYKSARLEPPTGFIWRRSPFTGAIAAHALANTQEPVWDKLSERLAVEAEKQIRGPAEMYARYRGEYASRATRNPEFYIEKAIRIPVSDALREQIQARLSQRAATKRWPDATCAAYELVDFAMHGQHSAVWFAYHDYLASFLTKVPGTFKGVRLAAQSAGWWWPFERTVVISERPEWIRRDRHGYLHAEDGPAIRYRDGWGVWAWHGTRVPRRVIEAPGSLTAEEIRDEPDPAIRELMVERSRASV